MCIIDRYIRNALYTSDDCSVYTSDEYHAHAYSIRACAIFIARARVIAGARKNGLHGNMGNSCTFVYTLSAYTLVISRNISVLDYECLSVLLPLRER